MKYHIRFPTIWNYYDKYIWNQYTQVSLNCHILDFFYKIYFVSFLILKYFEWKLIEIKQLFDLNLFTTFWTIKISIIRASAFFICRTNKTQIRQFLAIISRRTSLTKLFFLIKNIIFKNDIMLISRIILPLTLSNTYKPYC